MVTSSQFLIDSESKLREATAKMMAAMKRPTPPVDHSEMAAELEMSDLSMEMMAEELEMSDLSMETMAEELEMSDLTMESIADPETEHSP